VRRLLCVRTARRPPQPRPAASHPNSVEHDGTTKTHARTPTTTSHEFVSGEKGSERAREVLREVGAPASPIGTYPAASHVEAKAAVVML
jgi:hypothetical protein